MKRHRVNRPRRARCVLASVQKCAPDDRIVRRRCDAAGQAVAHELHVRVPRTDGLRHAVVLLDIPPSVRDTVGPEINVRIKVDLVEDLQPTESHVVAGAVVLPCLVDEAASVPVQHPRVILPQLQARWVHERGVLPAVGHEEPRRD